MISYWKCKDGFREIHQWKSGCWVKVSNPTAEELAVLKERFAVPDFTHDAEDIEERPRVDHENNWMLVFIRIPNRSLDEDGETMFTTAPMAVLIRDDVFITVNYFENEVLDDFISWSQRRHLNSCKGYDLLLSLMLSTSVWYLKYLKQMNTMMSAAEERLEQKMDNDELMRTMGLSKFLIYFITSLKGNMTVLARLKKRLRTLPHDEDLFEDVEIETQQALDTASIYNDILERQQETYSSVIGNNLNRIMKTLTVVTILLMIPTVVAGYYGMNVPNGLESRWVGFPLAVIISLLLMAIGYAFIRHSKFFK
ncbi:MAG: magnesium transporter CorA family protein [Muribaculaceae bacterium]|jgi:magnesium transporter|nr:magnesium transporter CorA family protein [Muribaculaceae bacterium]MBR0494205.1 magnesium transporter CorA family protein [Muribaculaceae bacterium]